MKAEVGSGRGKRPPSPEEGCCKEKLVRKPKESVFGRDFFFWNANNSRSKGGGGGFLYGLGKGAVLTNGYELGQREKKNLLRKETLTACSQPGPKRLPSKDSGFGPHGGKPTGGHEKSEKRKAVPDLLV